MTNVVMDDDRQAGDTTLRLGQVRAFAAVVAHGSFTEAARALGLTQPAVTAQIRTLEALAGGPLFVRGPSHAHLTELGRTLGGPLRTLQHALAQAESEVAAAGRLERGALSLGVCGPYLVMPLIGAFARRHPGVRVSTTFGNSRDLVEAVREQRLDLAAVTAVAPPPELFNLLIATQRLVFAAPRDHPLAARGRIRLDALRGERIITREPGSMTRRIFEEGLRRAGVEIAPTFEFASREALKEAAACGLGIGVVLDREFGRDDRLAALEIEDASFTAGEYLVSTPALAALGAVRAFLDMARERSAPHSAKADGSQKTFAEPC